MRRVEKKTNEGWKDIQPVLTLGHTRASAVLTMSATFFSTHPAPRRAKRETKASATAARTYREVRVRAPPCTRYKYRASISFHVHSILAHFRPYLYNTIALYSIFFTRFPPNRPSAVANHYTSRNKHTISPFFSFVLFFGRIVNMCDTKGKGST